MAAPPARRSAPPELAPAVRDQFRKNAEKGFNFARTIVTVACGSCGCEIVTNKLVASRPVLCANCVAPGVRKARETYWHKKAVAESEKDPISHPPFENAGEVADYLSGETITCLICDASLQRLDKHLPLHRISADEYRARFNIPFDRSLTSAPCRAKIRASLARMNSVWGVSPWRRKWAS
jgi:predicted transcriptional regulator